MNDRGFVEQRVMMGAAGLEHIMWQTLVLEGGMSERQYRDQDAHEKLRRLLTHAQIPSDIDAALLPVEESSIVVDRPVLDDHAATS